MKNKLMIATLALSASLAGTTALAGDAAAGKAKAAICETCHGPDGTAQKIKTYPSLAGQNEAYLVSAMQAYKAKQRSGGMAVVMQSQAVGLSQQDIENLAAYYASLK